MVDTDGRLVGGGVMDEDIMTQQHNTKLLCFLSEIL